MKKSDYISSAMFLAIAVTGIFVGHFWGGALAGFAIALLLFVTAGKFLFRKTEKRIDAAIRMKRMMADDAE